MINISKIFVVISLFITSCANYRNNNDIMPMMDYEFNPCVLFGGFLVMEKDIWIDRGYDDSGMGLCVNDPVIDMNMHIPVIYRDENLIIYDVINYEYDQYYTNVYVDVHNNIVLSISYKIPLRYYTWHNDRVDRFLPNYDRSEFVFMGCKYHIWNLRDYFIQVSECGDSVINICVSHDYSLCS